MGVAHCIVANIIVILGYFKDVNNPLMVADPFDGLKFIYGYIDFPVYYFFRGLATRFSEQYLYTILLGEIVILLTSVLYGVIAYIFAKALIPGDE